MSDYYVGLDMHKASNCIAVLNAEGKLVMESVIETSDPTILDFLKGLRGRVSRAAISRASSKIAPGRGALSGSGASASGDAAESQPPPKPDWLSPHKPRPGRAARAISADI